MGLFACDRGNLPNAYEEEKRGGTGKAPITDSGQSMIIQAVKENDWILP